MKRSEVTAKFLSGKSIIVANYCGLVRETKRNEAPKKNQAAETYLAKHSFLWGSKTYEVTEFANSQAELDLKVDLADKFTLMVVELDSIEETKWGNRIKGKVHRLEADEAPVVKPAGK